MTARPAPRQGPAFSLVAPFFLVAPAGLLAAGLILATSNADAFVAINLPRTVAITHALIIGWLTTTIMGASYQLVPVVVGGPLWSERLARGQFALHLIAVPTFVWAFLGWRVEVMGVAGAFVLLSIILYIINVAVALRRAPSWSLPRAYLALSLFFLAATIALGITWVGALQPAHAWFPITMGKLSAHAHLGLAGWLGLTTMGVSYQLVPMFNVVNRAKPRLGWHALAIMAPAVAIFAAVIINDPPPVVRPFLAVVLAAGPLTWAIDQVRLMAQRSRRRLDVQGRATYVSLAFLALTAALGFGASLGTPFTSDGQPARWLLAYAAAGILGWAGTTVIGNSYKILPFLIWFHRYQPRAGLEPVPLTAEIYSDRAATGVLAGHGLATGLLIAGALLGELELLRAGGLVLAAVAAGHAATMVHMFLPKRAARTVPSTAEGVAAR